MALLLKQSTAGQEIPLGYFVDSTDGNTEETGLTIANTDIKLWKSGATTLANKNSGGATHISNGIYYCVLDGTDTDTLGPMVVFTHVSGALWVRQDCLVLPANVYDSVVAGTDKLDVNTAEIAGSAVSTSSAQIGVNVVQISGDSTAADNCEAFYDGTGYAGTNNVMPTVTTVTNAVTANVTQISGDSTAADNAEAFFDGTGYAGTNNVIPTVTTVTNLTNAPTAGDLTATMKTSVTTAATAATPTVTAGTVSDKTGYALTAAYDAAKTAATQTSVDTIDDLLDTEVASIISTLGTIAGYIDTEVAAIKAKTDNLPASPASSGDVSTVAGYVDTEIASIISTLSTISGYIDTEIAALTAAMVKVQAAVYDSASVTGNVITLSNGATQTIGTDGDRTTA